MDILRTWWARRLEISFNFRSLCWTIISLVFEVLAVIEISKKLDKSPAWSVLFIFAAPIWFLILGLDSSRWNDIAGKESLAKGTILGYKIVEEEKEVEEEKTPEAKEEKTEE